MEENVNVFAGCTVYGEKWQVIASRNFNSNEIGSVRSNTVVSSQYGKSVCFFMIGGGQTYIPLGKESENIPLGSSIDMTKAKLVTLERTGDGRIVRVEAE